MSLSSLLQPILQNQVVTGLSFGALLGGAAYQLRRIPRLLQSAFLRLCTVQMTVMSSDEAFNWMERWLAEQPYAHRTQNVALRSYEDCDEPWNGDSRANWVLTPGTGWHLFWWKLRPVCFYKSISESQHRSRPLETLHLRTLGRSQRLLRRMAEESHDLITRRETVAVRTWNDGWTYLRGRTPRPIETLVLPPAQQARLLADLHWFAGAQAWYLQRGIPYRRGYLLSGPPGTGKTSMVMALASHLRRPVFVLNLGSVNSDADLLAAISGAETDAIVLIEDIDCARSAQTRARSADAGSASGGRTHDEAVGVTKAGLLNALDGITTPDGRIFVLTTNYPDHLDPALIRPGRADVHEVFGYLGAAEQAVMARRFYGEVAFEPLPQPLAPALMQAVFMRHLDNPAAARAELLAHSQLSGDPAPNGTGQCADTASGDSPEAAHLTGGIPVDAVARRCA